MLEDTFGTRVGNRSLDRMDDAVLDGPLLADVDARAVRDGRMSVVIWRATARVPFWSFLPVGVSKLSIYFCLVVSDLCPLVIR